MLSAGKTGVSHHDRLSYPAAGQALLVGAFTVSFILLQVLPGDAILIKFQNPDLGLSPAQIEEMRQPTVPVRHSGTVSAYPRKHAAR
ncbi:hypothetical protein ERHA55_51750 (plasmid) [Erwinia rhapontici]|nr:hypothetical protein ERHA55_51750 [Erwinia rhapontici]